MPIMEQLVSPLIGALVCFKIMNFIWLDSLLKVEANTHHGFGIWKPFECILKMGKEGAI